MIRIKELCFFVTVDHHIKAPVAWLPTGLVSWYSAEGLAVGLVASWVALIGGAGPRLRTAWHGSQDPWSCHWSGGDFSFNVPDVSDLPLLRERMRQGQFCLDIGRDLGFACVPGRSVAAPRLLSCSVQIECVGGRVEDCGHERELTGEVVVLHRGQEVVEASGLQDLALQPFPFKR